MNACQSSDRLLLSHASGSHVASRNPSVRIAEHAFFSSASLSILRPSFLVLLFVRQLQNRSTTPRFPALPRALHAHRCRGWHELSEVVKAFIFASRRKVILPRQTHSEREPCQTAESQGEGRPTDRTWIESVGEASLPCAGSILLSVLYGRHNYLLSDLLRSAIRRRRRPLKGSPKRGPLRSDAEWADRRRLNRAKTFGIPYSPSFLALCRQNPSVSALFS